MSKSNVERNTLIARAYAAGIPVREIASAAEVSQALVIRIARKAGCPPRCPPRPDVTPALARMVLEVTP